jgi:zinc protease
MKIPYDRPFEERLSNGIPVIFQHFDGAVASIYWWNQVGSCDEQKGEEGYAHFLEHMLFKDTSAKETGAASSGKTARAIESLGGDINAYTSFDQTVYHVTCSEHHWERVLKEFAVLARPQRFLKEDFTREREVILEELRKNEDSPERQHFQALFSSTFSQHPYGRPVIGFVKTLKAATVSKLEAFYRRNYVSGRMGIVMVGPIADADGSRVKNLMALLERYFGASVFPRREGLRLPRKPEPILQPKIRVIPREFEVQLPSVNFAFRVPELSHPDLAALDLLSGALTMGESSRFYQSLFNQKSLVTEVSGGLYVPHDPGMLYFHLDVDSAEKLNPALDETFRMLEESRENPPNKVEVDRILAHAESDRFYSQQTADGIAGRLGFLRFIVNDMGYDERYIAELRSVTPERVRHVAHEYLNCARLSGAYLIPKAMRDKIDTSHLEAAARKVLPTAASEPSARAGAKKAKATKEKLPYQEWQLESGLTILHRERSHSHVVSAQICVQGGLRLEIGDPLFSGEKDWGVSQCLAMTWNKGTGLYSARDIAQKVEGRAASLDGFSGRNTIGLQMTSLARDFGDLQPLFDDVFVGSNFPEEEVGHSKRVMEESIRTVADHSSQLCSKLFLEALYEHHPYRRAAHGSLESVAGFDSAKLRAYLAHWLRPERAIVSVVGRISRQAVEAWVEGLDQRWKSAFSGISRRPIDETLVSEPALKGPRWVEKRLGREQVHIIVGGLGSTIGGDDRDAIRLMHTLLGGQSGRLFIELREKQGLAYTVSPIGFEGVERGYQGVYIACSPEKEKRAIEGIHAVLKKLAEKGPTAEEMKRAKEYYLGRRAMDLQSDSSLAGYYGLERVYGLEPKGDEQSRRKIEAVTARQVQETCRKYLVDANLVTSVVG